ncbi:MAG: FtsX-like permease family protein, partial [Candidatus Binatia bacterium]
LIFNTMMIAVAERRRELGILRSAGMRRGEVLRLVLLESVLLGAVGSIAGIPLGIAFANALSAPFSAEVTRRFLPVEAPAVVLRPMPVVLGVALGTVSALFAALLPAREAIRVQPVEALRAAAPESPAGGRRTALVGAAILPLGLAIWVARDGLPFAAASSGAIATLVWLVGFSLLTPLAVRAIAKRSEPLLDRVVGPLAAFTSRNLALRARRLGIPSAAFVMTLAGAMVTATFAASVEHTLHAFLATRLEPFDLQVTSGSGFLSEDARPLAPALPEEIASLAGVARVDVGRELRVPHEGSATILVASDGELFRRGVQRLDFVAGDPTAAIDAMARGEAVITSEIFLRRAGKTIGETISLKTPSGEVHLPIAGVHLDMRELGVVLIDRRLYRRLWRDDAVSSIQVALRPDADRGQIVREIRRRWGERHGLFVLTTGQIRSESVALMKRAFAGAHSLTIVTLAIALLGIVNSLVASVLDRTRELGVLRAVGATRGQVARSVLLESGLVGFAAAALGITAGSIVSRTEVDIVLREMVGLTVLYDYPAGTAVVGFVASILLATLAGFFPARGAARVNVIRALEYE